MKTKMSPELRTALLEKGWNPDYPRNWGKVVDGSVGHLSLEKDGKTHHYYGPLTAVYGGGQAAIVRFG